MSFFNVNLPFNLLLSNFTQYSKNVLEYSDCLSSQLQSNDSLELKLNVKTINSFSIYKLNKILHKFLKKI